MKSFLHSGKLGDVIWSLPFIKRMGGGSLYLNVGVRDSGNNEIMMTAQSAASIIMLLEQQPYLSRVEIYQDQHIDYNLDLNRQIIFQIPNISIAASYFHRFGIENFSTDLDTKWLTVDHAVSTSPVVISRTERYLDSGTLGNDFYDLLKSRNLARHGIFVGLPSEHQRFQEIFDIKIDYYPTATILDLARVIAGAELFVGNENLANAINESIKGTAFLEIQKGRFTNFCQFDRPNLFYI